MSYDASNQETLIEADIASLTGNEHIREFLKLAKASEGLVITNIATLQGHIQTWVNNATPATSRNELLMATAAMAPSKYLQRTIQPVNVELSDDIAVPANCNRVLVTCGGGGGQGGQGDNTGGYRKGGGGGGSGAYVFEYELVVTPSGTLSVTVGHTIQVGNLTVEGGAPGGSASNADLGGVNNQGIGGAGGKVRYMTVPVEESAKVIYGTKGGDGNLEPSFVGPGGDGAPSYAGVGGVGGNSSNNYTGQDAPNNGAGGGADSNDVGANRGDGGENTIVELKFIVETVI